MHDEIIRWKNKRIYPALFNLILENKLNFEKHKIKSFKITIFKNDKFIKKYCHLILKYKDEEYEALPWYINRKIRVKVIETIEDLL